MYSKRLGLISTVFSEVFAHRLKDGSRASHRLSLRSCEPGAGLLLTSDGITQAGLGSGLPMGWQTEGVVRFVNDCLAGGAPPREIPERVHRQARRLWQSGGDDCSVVMALCCRGQVVNLLTGPPADPDDDPGVVRRFLKSEGLKIVCGGTTAELVARALKRNVRIEQTCRQRVDQTVAFCYHCSMSQPVKLSDELVLDARLTSKVADRSIAGQIEFWAQLGRAIEPLLEGAQVLALRQAGAVQPLSACLASVDTPEGRERVAEYLRSQPFPHYEPAPDAPGILIRIEADGTRTRGRFINRRFEAAE